MSYTRSTRYPELFRPVASPFWWCFLPNPAGGRQLRESTKCRDERSAHQWYLERVRSPDRSSLGPTRKERTLRDALVDRIEWLKSARENDDPTRKKLSADTIEFYEKKSRPLIHVLGRDTLLSQIGHEQIRHYIKERSKSASANTISKELTTLSMAMRLARKDGVACEPFRDIKPEDFATVYVPRKRWLPQSELEQLITVLPPKRAAIVAFIIATSATFPSEVLAVRRSGVDHKSYTVHIPGTKRETRDRKITVPSHSRAYFDLAVKHASGKGGQLFEPWTNVRRDLINAAEKLSTCKGCRARGKVRPRESCEKCQTTPKFAPLCPTDLRRTFAQWLVRAGVPHELVYPMMGHNSPKMMEQVYGKRDATSVAALVELVLKRGSTGDSRVIKRRTSSKKKRITRENPTSSGD